MNGILCIRKLAYNWDISQGLLRSNAQKRRAVPHWSKWDLKCCSMKHAWLNG